MDWLKRCRKSAGKVLRCCRKVCLNWLMVGIYKRPPQVPSLGFYLEPVGSSGIRTITLGFSKKSMHISKRSFFPVGLLGPRAFHLLSNTAGYAHTVYT